MNRNLLKKALYFSATQLNKVKQSSIEDLRMSGKPITPDSIRDMVNYKKTQVAGINPLKNTQAKQMQMSQTPSYGPVGEKLKKVGSDMKAQELVKEAKGRNLGLFKNMQRRRKLGLKSMLTAMERMKLKKDIIKAQRAAKARGKG